MAHTIDYMHIFPCKVIPMILYITEILLEYPADCDLQLVS